MTTNRTELCERLRTEIEVFRKAGLNPGELVPALAHIEELELEREQAVAEAQGYRDHAAKLQLELEATRQERNAAGVKARRELMPAYEARIAELEKERDALKVDAERYRWLRDFGKDGVNLKPPCEHVHTLLYSHPLGVIPTSRVITGDELDRAIDAALQAEKETR